LVVVRRTVLLMASMAAALALASGVAIAAEPYGTLDANTLDAGSNYWYSMGTETGQTFVAKHSGQVSSVQLKVYDAEPDWEPYDGLHVYLYSIPDPFAPQPQGMLWVQDILSHGTILPSEISTTPAMVTVELSGAATVRTGHHYAITARQPLLSPWIWNAHHNGNDPTTDIYPDGMVIRSSSDGRAGPFYRHHSTDTIFAVYVNQRPSVSTLTPVPGSKTRAHRPTIAATVNDLETDLTQTNISLSFDGKPRSADAFAYDADADRLTYQPAKRLASGKHTAKVVATDERGFAKAARWSFEIK
jgi:hypothetical protein